jgi:hypothetical protein
MNIMYEKLMDLANRLQEENRKDDAALIYSAAIKYNLPEPAYQKLTNLPQYDAAVLTRSWS